MGFQRNSEVQSESNANRLNELAFLLYFTTCRVCAQGGVGPVKASKRGTVARRRGWKREREWRTGGRREEGKKERKEGGERERETRKAEGRWKGVKREWVEGERRNMWFYL